ncbi:DUF1294-domain-containing protein [Westerdykella ornata]|uniref:DUF1294-domain-containing protein n=1 Tax=Westerdykella ornata TaxID=318751 RepID=A0A6A6JYA5_WESOR|nr:DUF1294-domain-containing protein [Westerdykella ornata]KAF2281204.1 DUF1294-domain-containing protein [Westerdykella ornata]
MAPRTPRRKRPLTLSTAAGLISILCSAFCLFRLYLRTGSLLPLIYTCLISGVTFLFYGYDKMQARNLEWRVKETTLHMLELAGGWPGALVGQHYFQHKTRKTGFMVVFWGIVVGWQGFWWVVASAGG